MNKRITEAFEKGKAFIPFITCGDPSLEVTEQLVYAMEEAGADLIELGMNMVRSHLYIPFPQVWIIRESDRNMRISMIQDVQNMYLSQMKKQ